MDKLLILAFIIFIFTPFSGLFFKQDPNQIRAFLKREPHDFPGITIKRLGRTNFKGIEEWFADHALLIMPMSKLWSNFNYYSGVSAQPEKIIVGKKGWLFLGNYFNTTLAQYLGKDLPTKKEMAALLNAFKRMNGLAKLHNIPFLVIIAPDKQDIYPDYLPSYIKKTSDLNRYDRLKEKLRANTIDFIDLRDLEIKAKDTLGKTYGDIYLKCDSHWNFLGASVANQAIVDYLIKQGLSVNQRDYTFLPRSISFGDLASILQIDTCESNSPIPDISNLAFNLWGRDEGSLKKLEPFEVPLNSDGLKTPYEVINKAVDNDITCLLIGDSFSQALGFYFHANFHTTVRVHNLNQHYKLDELVKKYHPNVIVFEIVERYLKGYSNGF